MVPATTLRKKQNRATQALAGSKLTFGHARSFDPNLSGDGEVRQSSALLFFLFSGFKRLPGEEQIKRNLPRKGEHRT
jgi:hypothetical protein